MWNKFIEFYVWTSLSECLVVLTADVDPDANLGQALGFTPEELEKFKFNMGVFFSPLGIKAFHEDFPKPKRGFKIATFGANTAKAARDLGLKIELEAPTEKYTSMTDALRHYLLSQQ